jgi:hypothetical protein
MQPCRYRKLLYCCFKRKHSRWKKTLPMHYTLYNIGKLLPFFQSTIISDTLIYIINIILHKGIVSRALRPSVFFSSNNPPYMSLIRRLKPFRVWLRIRRDIRDNCLQSSDFVVSLIPRDRFQRFQWDRRIGSRGFNETAGLVSVVSMRPQDWFPWFQWDRGIGSGGFNETAGSVWHSIYSYR